MSFECESAKSCSEDGVVRFCFTRARFSNETFFCDCSTWYGWAGTENCDEPTFGLAYYRFSVISFIIYSFIVMALSFRTMTHNLLYEENVSDAVNTLFFTVLFAFLSAFFLFLDVILTVRALFDPTKFEIYVIKSFLADIDQNQIGVQHARFSNVCIILSTFFQTLCALALMISWYRVIAKVSRFYSPARVKKIRRWESWLRTFGAVYGFLLFILIVTNFHYDAYAFVAVVNTLVSIFFVIAAARFQITFSTLQSTSRKDKSVDITINLVKKVCRRTAICLLIVSVASLIYFLFHSLYYENSTHGDLNYALFVRDIGYFGILTMMLITSWYVNSATEGAILADGKSYCLMFRWWDAKNLEMFPDVTSAIDTETLQANFVDSS